MGLALSLLVFGLRKVKVLEKVPAKALPWVTAVIGVVGYMKRLRPSCRFEAGTVWESEAIDITEDSEVKEAASAIFTKLSENDSLVSAWRKY